MANKVLSQAEIEALLSAAEGDRGQYKERRLTEKKVKVYDFRHPDKFSKEQLRALQTVFEAFARMVSLSLAYRLRCPVNAHLSMVEQMAYEEFVEQLPSPTFISIIMMDPLPDHGIMEMSLPVVYAFVDRLLGGSGKPGAVRSEATEIELSIMRSLMTEVLDSYKEAWRSIAVFEPNVEDIIFNPQYIQAALPGTTAAFAVIEMEVMGVAGTLSICIPYTVLEPVSAKLTTSQVWMAEPRRGLSASFNNALKSHLRRVVVPVVAELGGTDVSVRELLALQEGDVIPLDVSAKNDLPLVVGGIPRYKGRPGILGNRLAIEITRVLEEE